MDIEKFLSLGVEIETGISTAYDKVASLAVDKAVSERLKKIAGEELNHAAALRIGKNYLAQVPDLFLGVNMEEEELKQGLADLEQFHTHLQQAMLVLPALKRLLDLEMRFEKVHIGVSVSIADSHLTQLFKSLAKGDQSHIAILKNLIDGWEQPKE